MKHYKDFEKVYIGSSDIASLTLRSVLIAGELDFGGDGSYYAYEVFGDDVEIGAHYKKVFSGSTWLWIYDDNGKAYNSGYHDGMAVDVYQAGGYGCIIHWHKEEVVKAEDITFEELGKYPGTFDTDIVQLKDGKVFALNGWDGSKFMSCWECLGEDHSKKSKERYILSPVRRYQAYNIDLDSLVRTIDHINAFEVIDYIVSPK